jgi:hypothetical protein
MYAAVRSLGWRAFLAQEAPFAFAAAVIAELFYKFGSFTLELAAFAATWVVFSWLGERLRQALAG